MRKVIMVSMLVAFMGMFVSCDEKIDEITENLIGSFTANVDNASWKASIMAGSMQNGNLILTAKKDKELITLSFKTPIVGKYTVDFNNVAIYTSNSDSITETTYTGTTGEIELNSVDTVNKRVSGTFHYEGFSTSMKKVTVTNGVFKNIIYQ